MKYVKNTVLLLALAILGVMLVPPGEDTAEERDGETGDRPAAEAVAYDQVLGLRFVPAGGTSAWDW